MAQEQLAETIDRIQNVLEPVLAGEGFELIELQYKRGSRGGALLRLTIDTLGRDSYVGKAGEGPSGVTIDDCARVSRLLSPALDVEDLITSKYDFEVSSPGVNRPLTKPRHFQLAKGLNIRVKTRVPVDGANFYIAPLIDANEFDIALEVKGERLEIPLRFVSQANLEYEF
jgi:ribosome maturation factor RimP